MGSAAITAGGKDQQREDDAKLKNPRRDVWNASHDTPLSAAPSETLHPHTDEHAVLSVIPPEI